MGANEREWDKMRMMNALIVSLGCKKSHYYFSCWHLQFIAVHMYFFFRPSSLRSFRLRWPTRKKDTTKEGGLDRKKFFGGKRYHFQQMLCWLFILLLLRLTYGKLFLYGKTSPPAMEMKKQSNKQTYSEKARIFIFSILSLQAYFSSCKWSRPSPWITPEWNWGIICSSAGESLLSSYWFGPLWSILIFRTAGKSSPIKLILYKTLPISRRMW